MLERIHRRLTVRMAALSLFAALATALWALIPIFAASVAAQPVRASDPTGSALSEPLTNLSHLDSLTRDVRIGGTDMAVTLIYSNYPDYEPIVADGEGMACVDDSARAAVVYMREYESAGSGKALAEARKLLEFVMHMQDDTGAFYNFLLPDLTVNRTGPTSRPSLAWWSARAVWALGLGARVFGPVEPAFAERLQDCLMKTLDLVERRPTREGNRWLVNGESDVTSYYILGLMESYRSKAADRLRNAISAMSDAVTGCQKGSFTQFPYGVIYGDPGSKVWHQWGSVQAQALAYAARIVPERGGKWLRAAATEAESWFGDLLINGMVYEASDKRRQYPQIAYSVNAVVQGYYELYRTTGDIKYGNLAALAASWFAGGNPASASMYDVDTGRCYDGLDGPDRINKNSGAESTIEALMTFQSIDVLPVESRKFLRFTQRGSVSGLLGRLPESRTFGDSDGNYITLLRDPAAKSLDFASAEGE